MRRSLAIGLLTVAALASNAFAVGQARITGKVMDAVTKKTLPDATITVVSTEGKTFNEKFTMKPDGTYAIFLLDGTIHYKFTFAAPGYAPYEETMKLTLAPEMNTKDIFLQPATAVQTQVKATVDPAVAAYNEGAALANDGKDAEAIAKMKEAVTAKPELSPAWQALAKLYLRTKDYPAAIDASNKALALQSDDTDLYAVLYEAYTATGDKAKAAEAKTKMPANASTLFNDAAKLINANKDSQAEPLLKQAISVDENFAQAYYELGMIYVRGGKNADAKANLSKYLELAPNGRDAATAKEMLKYVK